MLDKVTKTNRSVAMVCRSKALRASVWATAISIGMGASLARIAVGDDFARFPDWPSAPVAGVPAATDAKDALPPTAPVARFLSESTDRPAAVAPRPAAENVPTEVLPPANQADMTLDQAISITLQADPKIRAGFEVIHQANADWLTSSLPPNPTIITDGIFLPLRPITPQNPGGPTQADLQVGYAIDWFLFGKRAAAMASAQLGIRQSEADYADLIRQRAVTTATAFFDVLEARALLELARQDMENLTRLEAATRKAVDAGGRPMVECNRVRLDLLKSQQDLCNAESALIVAKAKLRAQFGRIDADPSFDVVGNLDLPVTARPLPVEEAFALAQQNRPDIQSLRVQVSKAQADVVVERRKAYPQITPQLGYCRQFQAPVGSSDFDSWNMTLTATVPLFDRNQGNRAKAESIASQNGYNLQARVVDLRAEIEEAVQDFKTAYQKAGSVAQEQVKLATEVRDSIAKAYEAGGRPLIDVLDAERSYRDTYRLYISSRADYWRSLYKYNAAIGQQIAQ